MFIHVTKCLQVREQAILVEVKNTTNWIKIELEVNSDCSSDLLTITATVFEPSLYISNRHEPEALINTLGLCIPTF